MWPVKLTIRRWIRIIALFFLGLSSVLTPADAQRGGDRDRWELLGEQTVGFRVDTDSIVLGQREDWFRDRAYRSLHFVAERNDVHLISLGLVYLNGHAEDLRVDRLIRRDSELSVDLPGERSYIRQIDMRYRANVGIALGPEGLRLQQAVIKVYGERARRGGPPPVADRGWEEIDTRRFDRTDREVQFRVGQDGGRVGRIKLRVVGDSIEIRRVDIGFANGETQSVRVDKRLEKGEETDTIDLEGRRRRIERVTVTFDPRRRPGPTALSLLASQRSGDADADDRDDPYVRRGWTLLGTQSVGFSVDRDVIDIGQDENWFRNRGFRSLHIVAERNDIYLHTLRIIYFNGFDETLRVERRIAERESAEVELRGSRSFIRRLELTYRSRPGFGGRALVKVYGEPARR